MVILNLFQYKMVKWSLPNDIINVVITSQAKLENIG